MGTVAALGPGVDEFEIGQRVTVEIHAGCGQCKRPSLRRFRPLPQRSTSAISGFFAGLFATMEGPDFSCSFFIGFDSSSSRRGPL
jgi:threonine dehydrogenase-like Zn-dependent dehydrogenase